jgi:hypothetical protein
MTHPRFPRRVGARPVRSALMEEGSRADSTDEKPAAGSSRTGEDAAQDVTGTDQASGDSPQDARPDARELLQFLAEEQARSPGPALTIPPPPEPEGLAPPPDRADGAAETSDDTSVLGSGQDPRPPSQKHEVPPPGPSLQASDPPPPVGPRTTRPPAPRGVPPGPPLGASGLASPDTPPMPGGGTPGPAFRGSDQQGGVDRRPGDGATDVPPGPALATPRVPDQSEADGAVPPPSAPPPDPPAWVGDQPPGPALRMAGSAEAHPQGARGDVPRPYPDLREPWYRRLFRRKRGNVR